MSLKKVLNKITSKFSGKGSKPRTEDEFYEGLFISNASWNKPTPNQDESKRWEIIERFLKGIETQENAQILDLGCGRGWLSNLLSSYGKVLGIEPVGKVAEYAKTLFPNIDFLQGKAASLLDSHKGKFDVVVSSEVIEHVPDTEKSVFVNEIGQLLNTNGHAIISTPRADVQEEWLRYCNKNQPIEEWISENDLKGIFEDNGFKFIDISRIGVKPKNHDLLIDLYQVCLFQKVG